jgi:hypothetical protein
VAQRSTLPLVAMSTAEGYWSCARECRHWAAEAKSENDRFAFLEMAKMWTQLALEEAGISSISAKPADLQA